MSGTCTSCAAELVDGVRFCAECGSPTTTACPDCGYELRSTDKFCGSCGTPTQFAREKVEGHEPLSGAGESTSAEARKVISVLFADLVGFTEHTEQSDPEDVRARLTVYHRRFREDIERHGGRVEKLLGDGVFAVFGAPDAHEDDPERAVRAALRAQESVDDLNDQRPDLALSVRIAVTTGEAIVQLDESNVDREGIVGDVVNTASRLQGVAAPGTVVVDERTRAATEAVIDYAPLDPVSVKGKVNPIPIWRADGAKARLGVALEDKMVTSFVGRAHELSMLVDGFDRTVAESRLQVATISGEPGVGKSRLVAEFGRVLDDRPDFVLWRQGRCLPYGEGITFNPLAEIVKAQAGILQAENPEESRVKLRSAVAVAIHEPTDQDWVYTSLEALVGLDESRGLSPDEAAAGWRRFIGGLASEHPLVLVVEDLHWGDEALFEFLNELARWAFDLPLFLIATSRPEVYSEHPEWAGSTRNAVDIALAPLSADAISGLLDQLVDTTEMPDDGRRELVERCGGNPLYAIEYAGLIREGGAGLSPPDSVHALLAARLDLLDGETRRYLQAAAVVGRVFWVNALMFMTSSDVAATKRAIRELRDRELIWPVRSSSMEGQQEYVFRHVLVREVAYGQIPRLDRARHHENVAQWLEAMSAGNLAETAGPLSYHYRTALEIRRQLGEDRPDLTEQALRFTRTAAELASKVDAQSALSLFVAAHELAEDPKRRAELTLQFSQIAFDADPARTSYDRLVEAAEIFASLGDVENQALAIAQHARAAWSAGEYELATKLMQTAADLVEPLPPSATVGDVLRLVGSDLYVRGRDVAASDVLGRALDILREYGSEAQLVPALAMAGGVLEHSDLERARALQTEALELAQKLGLTAYEVTTRNNLAHTLRFVDGPAAIDELLRPAINLAQQRGLDQKLGSLRLTRMERLLDAGRAHEVLDELDAARAAPHWDPSTAHAMAAQIPESTAVLHLGRSIDAQRIAEAALASAEASNDIPRLVEARSIHLAASADIGVPTDKLALLSSELLDLADDVDALNYLVFNAPTWIEAVLACAMNDRVVDFLDQTKSSRHPGVSAFRQGAQGVIALESGQHEEANSLLDQARRFYSERDFALVDHQAMIWQARALYGLGEEAEAEVLLEKARDFFTQMGGKYFLKRISAVAARS